MALAGLAEKQCWSGRAGHCVGRTSHMRSTQFEIGDEEGGAVAEARTGKRFPLELPIKIHEEHASGETKGLTGNLSAAGVYIRADAAMEIGSPVEVEIKLTPDVTVAQESVTIQCKGRVLGSDPTWRSPDSKGVAGVSD